MMWAGLTGIQRGRAGVLQFFGQLFKDGVRGFGGFSLIMEFAEEGLVLEELLGGPAGRDPAVLEDEEELRGAVG